MLLERYSTCYVLFSDYMVKYHYQKCLCIGLTICRRLLHAMILTVHKGSDACRCIITEYPGALAFLHAWTQAYMYRLFLPLCMYVLYH